MEVAFSEDEDLFVVSYLLRDAKIQRFDNSKTISFQPPGNVLSLDIDPSGALAAMTTWDPSEGLARLTITDLKSGESIVEDVLSDARLAQDNLNVCFDEDGEILFVSDANGVQVRTKTRNWRVVQHIPNIDPIVYLSSAWGKTRHFSRTAG